MTTGTPPADVDVTEELILHLLKEQHPDLAPLPLSVADAGWDNVMYRLGDHLAVRIPRRELGAQCIVSEQDWLPVLAPALPLPTPIPQRLGRPGCGYPWRWSVVPWLAGEPADQSPPDSTQGEPLANFLLALHQSSPENAPYNKSRGVPLSEIAEIVEGRMTRLRQLTPHITNNVDTIWQEALNAPAATEVLWVHGDLHARNVLVENGMISGIIDWGDMASGDVATDLAAVWALLGDANARQRATGTIQSFKGAAAARQGLGRGFWHCLAGDRVDRPSAPCRNG